MKAAWKNASKSDQKAFLSWARMQNAASAGSKSCSADGYLLTWAHARIQEIMKRRGITQRAVRLELGFGTYDTSLWTALRKPPGKSKIAPKLILALDRWLEVNRKV